MKKTIQPDIFLSIETSAENFQWKAIYEAPILTIYFGRILNLNLWFCLTYENAENKSKVALIMMSKETFLMRNVFKYPNKFVVHMTITLHCTLNRTFLSHSESMALSLKFSKLTVSRGTPRLQ